MLAAVDRRGIRAAPQYAGRVSSAPPSSESPSPDPGGAGSATVRFAVEGMHCASCTTLVEESLVDQAGVASASVDLDSGEAVVRFDPAEVGLAELSSVIAEAGYVAAPIE